MCKKPVTAIIVGGGHRSGVYGNYSFKHSDELKIIGVVDPDEKARNAFREKFDIPTKNCFVNVEELAARGKIADAVINGTMDKLHVATSVPLLNLGYDILLEKPFAVNKEEMLLIKNVAEENNSKVMVCHVLRYSAFYNEIKRIISEGRIGDILSIQMCEDVSYHHYSTSYIRGKWANSDTCGTSMMLAKCCHDIDLMMWLMGDVKPEFVTSTGGLKYFRRENAPENAGERCMVDCPLVDTCFMSAKRIYLDMMGRWDHYVWLDMMDRPFEEKAEYLKYKSPYGRCAFKCDNNVVDHQTVMIRFENGATGSHNLTGGTAFSQRMIRVLGTLGEINGTFESQKFTVSYIEPSSVSDHKDIVYDFSDAVELSDHGGGDHTLVADFIKYVRNEETSVACTSLADSVKGHLVVFCADESMANGGMPIRTEL